MPSPRRLLILLLGYIAAAASAAIVLVLYLSAYLYLSPGDQSHALTGTIAAIGPVGWKIVAMLLWICLPVAWIPLTVGLALWRRVVGGYRLLGSIVVGTITGATSQVWFFAVVDSVAHAMDGATVAYAASAGAFGGLVFWAIALRRDQILTETAEPVRDMP